MSELPYDKPVPGGKKRRKTKLEQDHEAARERGRKLGAKLDKKLEEMFGQQGSSLPKRPVDRLLEGYERRKAEHRRQQARRENRKDRGSTRRGRPTD